MKKLNAVLHAIERLASGIHSFEFRPADGAQWPAPTAGSHVDVHLPNGLVRSYSLTSPADQPQRYRVAVSREAGGGGGSRCMHDTLRVGDALQLSEPRNNFPLREGDAPSVLFAGGIGITPIWSMVNRLSDIGRPWTLHYTARAPENAAFVDELLELAACTGNAVHLNFDGGSREKMLDLKAIVAGSAAGAEFYCCGPAPMLRAYEEACKDVDRDRVHLEYFAAPVQPAAAAGTCDAFQVELTKSGKTVEVGPNTTILDALLAAGVDAPYSCMGGVCRACETRVVSGTPDHRDFVLSEAEQRSGDKIILCCSRAKTPTLVLDL
jgi:tetrachlorobenzoquinone reductase